MAPRLFMCVICLAQVLSGQTLPGLYSRHERAGATLRIFTATCEVRVTFTTPEVVRIDYLPVPVSQTDSSLVVIRQPDRDLPLVMDESADMLTFASSRLQVRCRKNPLRLAFTDSSGRVLLEEAVAGGMATTDAGCRLRFAINPREHFYGTGERGTALDKRGQAFDSYNTQVGGYSTPLGTMNINVPFVCSSNGYALFIDNGRRGAFDLGATDSSWFSYTAADSALSWYVIQGATVPEQLMHYTVLTGRQPLPPRWAFGYIQSKNRYRNETEARAVVRTMREKRFPCDGLVLDLAWFRNMGDVSWDTTQWPHHESMVSDFLATGIKTILITEPYIVEPSKNFREADSLGYLAHDASGRTYLLDDWWSCRGCNAALLDITNPDARRWWWNKHPGAFGRDVGGIWTDLGEPERHPDDMRHHAGPAAQVHNTFNLLWARTLHEGFAALRPGDRQLNLTRSGFAGIQRYGVLTWSGDVARSWGGLQVQIPMMLTMGMSGLAYHHSDIGGYARMPTTPELYVRWMEFGVFSPISRAHGAGESVRGSPTEPWQFGPRAETLCRELIRLRYRLLPYTYTCAYANSRSGMPIARPLFFLDPSDPRLAGESSSYMWGDAMLVSPVVTAGDTMKDLYLPRGVWFDFWTGRKVDGGTECRVNAPLGHIPLFIKAGSIIPTAPEMEFSDQRGLDTLTLLVYPPEAGESSYTLYEDDGKTLAYQQGDFALTTFSQRWSQQGRAFRIMAGPTRGTYTGRPVQRSYVFDIRNIATKPVQVQWNGAVIPAYRPVSPGRVPEYTYDTRSRRIVVQVPARPDSACTIEIQFP